MKLFQFHPTASKLLGATFVAGMMLIPQPSEAAPQKTELTDKGRTLEAQYAGMLKDRYPQTAGKRKEEQWGGQKCTFFVRPVGKGKGGKSRSPMAGGADFLFPCPDKADSASFPSPFWVPPPVPGQGKFWPKRLLLAVPELWG